MAADRAFGPAGTRGRAPVSWLERKNVETGFQPRDWRGLHVHGRVPLEMPGTDGYQPVELITVVASLATRLNR